MYVCMYVHIYIYISQTWASACLDRIMVFGISYVCVCKYGYVCVFIRVCT